MACNYNDDNSVSEINSTDTACAESSCEPVQTGTTCTPYTCGCGCDPCQCQQSRIASPTPFYNQALGCQEDHTKVLLQQNFVTAVTTGVSFNMPECDSSISIVLPGVQTLLVGGYLWNPTFGYLHVVSFDFTTGRAIVTNECQVGNASPGTEIPSCTLFNVVDPPFEVETECGEGSFITADFIVPAIGASVTLQISSTVGLTINNKVQVGSGVYTLTSIPTANSAIIKNDTGYGAAPGTTVSAYDVLGHCITPVTPYVADTCNSPAEATGSLVICNSSGIQTTLDATMAGQVPVCIDPATNTFEAQNTYIEIPICTFLVACLNLISGTDTYTIQVDDTSEFTIGNVIVISYPGLEDILWYVSDIPDGTHMVIEAVVPNTIDLTIPENTEICHSHCCDELNYYITHPCKLDWSSAQSSQAGTIFLNPNIATTIAPLASYTSPICSQVIVNPTCNDLEVFITANFVLVGSINASMGAWARLLLQPAVGYSIVPAVPGLIVTHALGDDYNFGPGAAGAHCVAYEAPYNKQYVYTGSTVVPAGQAVRFDAQFTLTHQGFVKNSDSCCVCANVDTEGTGLITLNLTNIFIHHIAVAVQAA